MIEPIANTSTNRRQVIKRAAVASSALAILPATAQGAVALGAYHAQFGWTTTQYFLDADVDNLWGDEEEA